MSALKRFLMRLDGAPRTEWRCRECGQRVRKTRLSLGEHAFCFLFLTMEWIGSDEYQGAMRAGRDPGEEPMPVVWKRVFS